MMVRIKKALKVMLQTRKRLQKWVTMMIRVAVVKVPLLKRKSSQRRAVGLLESELNSWKENLKPLSKTTKDKRSLKRFWRANLKTKMTNSAS